MQHGCILVKLGFYIFTFCNWTCSSCQ